MLLCVLLGNELDDRYHRFLQRLCAKPLGNTHLDAPASRVHKQQGSLILPEAQEKHLRISERSPTLVQVRHKSLCRSWSQAIPT